MNDLYASSYHNAYQMGQAEGSLIGRLEVMSEMVEKGIFSVDEAAERCDMTKLEFLMKVGYPFDEVVRLMAQGRVRARDH